MNRRLPGGGVAWLRAPWPVLLVLLAVVLAVPPAAGSPRVAPTEPASVAAPTSAAGALATVGSLVVPTSGGSVLPAGSAIVSPSGRYLLAMQADGNLVEYNLRGQALWHTATWGSPGAFLVLQSDGNLVLYTASGRALWATHTTAPAGSVLVVQNDANLVLYGSRALWANNAVDVQLIAPGVLTAGESISSPDRRWQTVLQADGNLVTYGPGGQVGWASGTGGNPGAVLALQADGNCVIYSAAGRALWASGTFGSGIRLTQTNEGALVLVGPQGRLWPPERIGVPHAGTGTFAAADFPAGVVPNAGGRTVRFSVEIEGGIVADPTAFAGAVGATLLDPRGWQSLDGIRFEPVSAAQVAAGARVDVRVSLSTPATVDRLCAPLPTGGTLSCWNGSRAVINAVRWRDGAATYGNDLANYRIYLISHEVGHGVGHSHRSCPGAGRHAPVMVQQTIGLGGCRPWPWPRLP